MLKLLSRQIYQEVNKVTENPEPPHLHNLLPSFVCISNF